eukprot:scaffold18821_cov51-Attheya_sp.AAC.5
MPRQTRFFVDRVKHGTMSRNSAIVNLSDAALFAQQHYNSIKSVQIRYPDTSTIFTNAQTWQKRGSQTIARHSSLQVAVFSIL